MNAPEREPSCDCIALTNKTLSERGLELPLVLSLSGQHSTTIEIRLCWLDDSTTAKRKRRGQRAPVMLPTFCPFCGVRYGWQEAAPIENEARP